LDRFRRILTRKYLGWWLALLAVVVMLPSLWVGLVSDDCLIEVCQLGSAQLPEAQRSPFDVFSFCRGGPSVIQGFMDRGLLPWWTPPDFRFAFWRPLSSLSHWADFTCYPNHPALMHLHSILWYAALALAVTAFYRRLFTAAWVAGLAALLYVLDDAHAFPVAWVANRNGLMAAFFGVLVLLTHDRWRREGWWPGAILGVLLLAIGLNCGESALAATGYIAAYALFLDRGKWVSRLATLLPYVVPVLAWVIVYRFLGCGTTGSGQYVDPLREPVLFVKGALIRLPILIVGQMAFPSSSLWPFVPTWAAHIHTAFAVLVVFFMAWVLWPMVKHEPLARFCASGMVLSMLPFCATYPCDRLLFLPGLGGMGLVAQFLHTRVERPDWAQGTVAQGRPGRVLAICWIAIHGVLGPVSLPPSTLSPLLMGKTAVRASNTFPKDPQIAQQDVVIVNNPADYLIVFTPFKLVVDGSPVPRRMRVLSVGLNAFTVERTSKKTLVFHVEDGLFNDGFTRTLRGPGYPLAPGFTARIPGMTAEVLATTDDGHPTAFSCTFDVPLEDPSLRFITWVGKGYVPFELPAVGETRAFPKTSWFWTF
jgi:hypothetical protein